MMDYSLQVKETLFSLIGFGHGVYCNRKAIGATTFLVSLEVSAIVHSNLKSSFATGT